MSIRSKFILVLFLCLAAMAASVCLAARFYTAREADAAFVRKASAQLDRVDDIIHIYFKGAEQAAKNLAALPEARNVALARSAALPAGPASGQASSLADAEQALVQRLEALSRLVPGVEAAFCGYKNGSFHSSPLGASPEGYDARTQSWYSDTAWGLAETSVTSIAISDASKSLVATVAARIRDAGGETLGVAGLVMNIGALTDGLRDVRIGHTGYVVLFDSQGRVLFDPKAQENLLRPAADADPALFSLMQLPAGQHAISRKGAALLAFSRVFPDTRWKAAFLTDAAEQAAPAGNTLLTIIAVSLMACLVLGAIGTLLAFGATRPLYALIRQSKALAAGNAEALAGIAGRGPDISSLQGSIGQLMGRIMLLAQAEKEHAGEIERYARKVVAAGQGHTDKASREAYRAASRDAAQALTPVAAQTAAAVTGLAQWMATIHANAQAQTEAAANIRAASAALRGDAVTVARQAAETEKNAEAALELAQKTDKQMRDMTRAAEGLEETARTLAPGLESFREDSREMAAMTAVVRDVAEEANVLGLKLSIEVSSAGETGKRFLPVADEMRALAEKAMAAAGSMDDIIAAFDQAHAAHALAVNKNATASKRASANAAKAGSAFAIAIDAVATTVEQIRVLSTTLEGMAQAEAFGTENADAVLRAACETGDALKGLDDAAAALSLLAENLGALADNLGTDPAGGESLSPVPAAIRAGQKQLD